MVLFLSLRAASRSVVTRWTCACAASARSLASLRPTRMGSGMITSSSEILTPPCLMMATIERMRCWLVPMRPVTPFMMIPILCSRILPPVIVSGTLGGFPNPPATGLRRASSPAPHASHVLEVGALDVGQELVLVLGPAGLGEHLHLVETLEAGRLHPAADGAHRDASLAGEAAVLEQVGGGGAPVADVEGG